MQMQGRTERQKEKRRRDGKKKEDKRKRRDPASLAFPSPCFVRPQLASPYGSPCLYENVGIIPKVWFALWCINFCNLQNTQRTQGLIFISFHTAVIHVHINMVLHLSAFSDFLGKWILMRQNPELDGKNSKWLYLYASYPSSLCLSLL